MSKTTADFVNEYFMPVVALIIFVTVVSLIACAVKTSNERTASLENAYKYKIIQHSPRLDHEKGVYYTNSFELNNKTVKFVDNKGKYKILIGDDITIVEN